jgi:hypothetical protein
MLFCRMPPKRILRVEGRAMSAEGADDGDCSFMGIFAQVLDPLLREVDRFATFLLRL